MARSPRTGRSTPTGCCSTRCCAPWTSRRWPTASGCSPGWPPCPRSISMPASRSPPRWSSCRIFEPELCQRLIEIYDQIGERPVGRDAASAARLVGVLDDFKPQRDVFLDDPALRQEIQQRPEPPAAAGDPAGLPVPGDPARTLPRSPATTPTRRLSSRPHRDNRSLATQHRRFAVIDQSQCRGIHRRRPAVPGVRPQDVPAAHRRGGGVRLQRCSTRRRRSPKASRYAFLPFLYDEAGEAIRLANLALDTTPAAPRPLESLSFATPTPNSRRIRVVSW